MFNLAMQAGKLIQKPHIPFLKEHNARVGFFEREQFLAVLSHLPLRLDPGKTNNGEGRTVPMTREPREVLEQQRTITENVQRQLKIVCPRVFHRSGRPIKSFRVAFRAACVAAGCPGRVLHDLRRTAVRNFVRAGIPERVAMQMTGHKTRSVFERYNIVSEGDLFDAARRLDAATERGGRRGSGSLGLRSAIQI